MLLEGNIAPAELRYKCGPRKESLKRLPDARNRYRNPNVNAVGYRNSIAL